MKYTHCIEIKYFANGQYFFSEYHHERTTLKEIKERIKITAFLLEIPHDKLDVQIKYNH